MIRTQVADMFSPRDAAEDFVPSVTTMGLGKYFLYALLLMTVLHTTYIMLNTLSFANISLTLISIGSSSLTATILCVLIDIFTHPRRQYR